MVLLIATLAINFCSNFVSFFCITVVNSKHFLKNFKIHLLVVFRNIAYVVFVFTNIAQVNIFSLCTFMSITLFRLIFNDYMIAKTTVVSQYDLNIFFIRFTEENIKNKNI